MQLVIIGNGIAANLAALYFGKILPESVAITLVGPGERGGLPLVGESLIEITGHFLEQRLGLGPYLRDNHYPKFGLSYYFKLHPEDPQDRTYCVQGTRRAPDDQPPLPGWEGPARPPAWQLNRETFDRDIQAMVDAAGRVWRIDGKVTGVVLDGSAGHRLAVEQTDGSRWELRADWLIDASGRRQLLARQLDLVVRPEGQRDCFWFRLADFDRTILKDLNALGPMPPGPGEAYHYDRYYTTHHFLGDGNWIWLIPLKAEDGSELMSVGLVSRPDVCSQQVNSVEAFLEQVGARHPVVAELVRSGRVVDSSRLRNYHYLVERVYSADRWGIIGDAAFAPDPMFSNGLAFCTIQLEQLGQLIAEECAGRRDPAMVEALSDAFLAPVVATQTAITNWYQTMGDAYLSTLRLTWIEFAYFYLLLPMVINRCHYQPDRLKYWKFLSFREGGNGFEIPRELLEARALFGEPTPEHFLYKGEEKVNPRALQQLEQIDDIQQQIREGIRLRAQFVREVRERIASLHAGATTELFGGSNFLSTEDHSCS